MVSKDFKIKFRWSKKSIIGILFALVSMITFLWVDFLILGVAFALCFLVSAFAEISCSEKVTKLLNYIWLFCSSLGIYLAMQVTVGAMPTAIERVQSLLINILLVSAVLSILFTCTSSIRGTVLSAFSFFMLFAVINYFVIRFRGVELGPIDFLAVGTAMNVVGEYKFDMEFYFFCGVFFAVLYCYLGFCLKSYKGKRRLSRIPLCLGICVVAIVSTIVGGRDLTIYRWRQLGSMYNGCLLNFAIKFRDMIVQEEPDGYSLEAVEALAEEYEGSAVSESERTPNIIVIMNESFADFRVFNGELNTNKEVTPFLDSLTEDTIRGYALASVYGGSTASSEYEFLSGNSMGFLAADTCVYQQHIKDEVHSVAADMANLGYDCYACHPHDANGWSRDVVYPLLGFEESYFVEDFPREKIMRSYVSDQEMYEEIIKKYEHKEEGSKMFMFGVSMQNHGGYTYEGENFENEIELTGYSKEYKSEEQYLTLAHYSDQALEYLINYFKTADEDVVVLFFGDHLPNVSEEFYEELNNGALDTLDEKILQYKVPFVVWANYDIEELVVECTSLNFLSNYLYEASGIELPSYNQFLKEVNEQIPAMNSMGYYSKAQEKFISYDEAEGKEAEILNDYRILQYNSIFDTENCNEVFFPLKK